MRVPFFCQFDFVRISLISGLAIIVFGSAPSNVSHAAEGEGAFWNNHIRPLFKAQCWKCHGGAKQKGGLDLRTIISTLKGGDSGSPVISGKPEESLIYKVLLPGADPHMPPGNDKQLRETDLSLVKNWIEAHMIEGDASKWASASAPNYQPLQPLPPSGLAGSRVIDDLVRNGWEKNKISPANQTRDRSFVRRIYLDLIGRIPTPMERQAFLLNTHIRKRETLIDTLLAHPEFASHMREMFDVLLLGRVNQEKLDRRKDNSWHSYLEAVFRENRPWNEFVGEIILARSKDKRNRGAAWFLYEQNNDHQKMAESIAPIAFGVDVQCAQCHDHPSAPEIKQAHYWGLVTAFNRSKNVNTNNGPGLSESAIGGFISYKNLSKVSAPAELTFLNGKSFTGNKPKNGKKETDDPSKYLIPPTEKNTLSQPKFSRREVLASAALTDNPRLAKAFVNRVWSMLIGRGIVHPVEEMSSEYPPSHPELLNWLAVDFEKSGYDIKLLIRNIVLSKVYQLDSVPPGSNLPPQSSFAVALEKPLHAEVLFRSLLVATGQWTGRSGIVSPDAKSLRSVLLKRFPDLFPRQYNASIQQAMFLSNNPMVRDLLQPQSKASDGLNLPSILLKMPDPAKKVSKAFDNVFGRPPNKDELSQFEEFLLKRQNRPSKGIEQMLWAMVCSPEFLMNH